MNQNSRLDPTKLPYYNPAWSLRPLEDKAITPEERTVPKIISPRLARKISAAYRCAACWSPLIILLHIEGEHKGLFTVECSYCGGAVSGFVTRSYIAHRIAENEADYAEAKLAMQAAYPYLFEGAPLPKELSTKPKHTREDNISVLGF